LILLILIISFLLGILSYLVIDYRGPGKIELRAAEAFNMPCLRAKELIVQEFDRHGTIWASRGLLLYSKKENEDSFRRVTHVPAGFSYFWLNNFSLFRKFTNKPECMEVSITARGDICAMANGRMWHLPGPGGKFTRSMRLRHFGFGVGRGILSNGILSMEDGSIYFGEYFRNPQRTEKVHIYRSMDHGLSWDVAYTFEPGLIRHVHSLQLDPFTGHLWVCTGDYDHEAIIAWSDNGLKDIQQIGTGSQTWRTTQLVFTRDAVYWGSDTGSVELAGIYRWDRNSGEVNRIYKSAGGILFGTRFPDGTMVFSVDREGFENELDRKTRLIMLKEGGDVSEVEAGTWRHWERGLKYSFAMLRFPRNQGSVSLPLSVINQKEFAAGELLIFQNNTLN